MKTERQQILRAEFAALSILMTLMAVLAFAAIAGLLMFGAWLAP